MSPRLISSVGLVALLVVVATPAGPWCAWASQTPHSCCAESRPQVDQARPCCGGADQEPAAPATSLGPSGCDCLHAPASGEVVPVGTPTVPAPPDMVQEVRTGDPAVRANACGLRHPADHVPLDGSSPPPLFLIDCAFLI